MENQAGNGLGAGSQSERQKTAEEIALIHAAMMEELGIGRMDTLPLEDRGHKSYVPITNVVKPKRTTNEVISRWQNLEFDDVDESFSQLDNIADGQLYRLRRGTSSGTSYSPSFRGGHSSGRAGRGGHGPSRGSHSGVGRGEVAVSSGNARESTTTSTFFIDARRGSSKHARLEQALAHLRAPPRPIAPSLRGNHHKAMVVSSNPAPLRSPFAATLATPQDFLHAMGLQARAPPTAPAAAVSPSVPDQPGQPSPQRVPVIIPQTSSIFQPGQSVFPTSVPRSTGLSGSRWANPQIEATPKISTTQLAGSYSVSSQSIGSKEVQSMTAPPPPVPQPTPFNPVSTLVAPILKTPTSAVAVPPPTIPYSNPSNPAVSTLFASPTIARSGIAKTTTPTVAPSTEVPRTRNSSSTPSPGALKEYLVKANRNGATDRIAKARLKEDLGSQLVLELEVSNVILLRQPLLGGILFQFDSGILTFFVGSDTYNIKFRLSHEASAFVDALPLEFEKPASQSEDQPGFSMHSPTIQTPQLLVVPTPDIENIATAISSTSLSELPTTAITPLLIDVSEDVLEEVSAQTLSGSALEDLVGLVIDFEVGEILQMLDIRCGGSFLEKVSSKGVSEEAIVCEAESVVTALVGTTHCSAVMSQLYIDAYVKELSKKILAQARLQSPASSSEIIHDPVVVPMTTSENTNTASSFKTTENLDVPVSQAILPIATSRCNVPTISSQTAKVPSMSNVKKEHGTVDETGAVNSSNENNIVEKIIRYSVEELVSLRYRVTILKEDLDFDRGIFGFGVISPQKMCRPSWDAAPTPTTFTVSSMPQKSLPVPQVQKIETPNATANCEKTDSALWGAVLSSIDQKKSDDKLFRLQSRGRHRPQTSVWDVPRLTKSFEDLKIAASIESPATVREIIQDNKSVTSPPAAAFPVASNPVVGDMKFGIRSSTTSSVPNHHNKSALNPPAIDLSRPVGSHAALTQLPAYTQSILEVSNKKEDLAKAKLPGLSSSKWATTSCADLSHFTSTGPKPFVAKPVFQPHQPVKPQYSPVYQTVLVPDPVTGSLIEVTGMVKVGSVPVVAHHLDPVNTMGSMTPINYQENCGFQTMPFSPRPNMYDRHMSNASSTSDFKPDVSSFNPAPRTPNGRGQLDHSASARSASRSPLSPTPREYIQVELQSRLDRSISERAGSVTGARNL